MSKASFKADTSSCISVGSVDKSNAKNHFFALIKDNFKSESKGIQPILDEEKHDDSLWNAATMWLSVNLVFSAFALGVQAITVFGLTFWEAVVSIVVFTFIAAIPVAYFSTFGASTGLRQMVLSKFLVGLWGMRIFAVINCINCIGWGALNTMSSAQLLNIVNNHSCPEWAACLVIVICIILVSMFGYTAIHAFERWAWLPNLTIFLIIIARLKKSEAFTFGDPPFVGGSTTAGSMLSYGSALFGFTAGWTLYAADYTVYQPRNANKYKIFVWVFVGLYVPTTFTFILGAACGTGTVSSPRWNELYEKNDVAGIVWAVLVEDSLHGFGQFCCVLLSLSVIGNNIPNIYSIALTLQAITPFFARVPRIAWSIFASFVTLAIAIPGFYYFDSIMGNFMALMGYALSIYLACCLSEHLIYNKGSHSKYDWTVYNINSEYPIGIAAVVSFCCGVAGAVVGMAQVWYTGPIAIKIGEFGGDIGLQLAFVFSFISYNLVRLWEIKKFR